MTLHELWLVIRHRVWFVICLPIVCVAICAVSFIFLAGQEGSASVATTRIVVNSQTGVVGGLAASEARLAANSNSDYSVTAKADTNTATITISVRGPEGETCLEIANDVAERAKKAADEAFAESENSEYKVPFRSRIEPATLSEPKPSNDFLKYLIASFAGGLFVAICIVAGIAAIRQEVISVKSVQDRTNLVVLGVLPDDGADRFFANVTFSVNDNDGLKSVCIIPAGNYSSAVEAARVLTAALDNEPARCETDALGADRVSFSALEGLQEGVSGLYEARDADLVIVSAFRWKDSLKQIDATIFELTLAHANIGGIALIEEGGA